MKKLFEGVYKEINFEIIEYGLYKDEKYLCGYVEVPKLNKHFKDYGYDFSEIECHGGITYNEGKRSTGEGHYIGFDTMHYFSNIKHRTIEFCKTECKNIIKQLLNKENKMGLCMRVKKSGDEFDIGYGGYFALRYHIISCIDKEIAYKWKKGCIYGKEYYLTLEEFKVLYDSKL